jgi:hypothetical protein
MKLKGEYPRGRPRSRWEQVRKDGTRKEEHGGRALEDRDRCRQLVAR